MSKKRVHEIAKEFGVESKQVISILQQHNINVTKAVNSVDDSGYEIVKKQLGKKSEAPKVAQKKEKKVELKSAPTAAHKQEAASHKQQHSNRSNEQKKDKHKQAGQKQDDQSKQKDHKKGNVRHVQISEPTRKSDGKQHGGDRANNRPNNTRNNDNRNNGRSNDVRNNDSRNNDNRNSDNRNNDNRNSNNDRRNKKNKKGGNNRPQSLLSTSMQKKKNRVKHRNEQYLQQKAEAERKAEAAIATEIELSGPLTVKDLAEKMGREVSEIIKKLMLLGVMASINQEVDVDTATIVAEEFGVTVTEVEPEEDPTDVIEIEDAPETLKLRPPVVTIMGHVDHGKTSLLDVIREHGLLPEEWGGDVIMVPVSAKQKQGIDDLLENILLVAEVMELKANPNRKAYGVVIEAQLDKGRGAVCTVLVQKGSLRVGDTVLAGTAYGKVRAMTNERGEKVKVARPSMPVEILGFSEVPQAGEIINGMDDNEARAIAEKRIAKQRVQELQATHKVTLDDIFNQIQQGELKDLNIIIKADVQGSVEALRQSLEGIKNPEVRIVIVHAAVGAINESDIMLASASNAIVMGFNVRPDANVRRAAEQEKVDLRTYRVIYDAINDVESAMRGMLAPQFKEVVVGRAEVRQVISTPKAIVAGSYVTEGRITNDSEVRLIRDGIVVFEGKVDSLRRFKDEVKEVKTSFECGISLEGYRDIKEGDVIEAYLMEEIAPQL